MVFTDPFLTLGDTQAAAAILPTRCLNASTVSGKLEPSSSSPVRVARGKSLLVPGETAFFSDDPVSDCLRRNLLPQHGDNAGGDISDQWPAWNASSSGAPRHP